LHFAVPKDGLIASQRERFFFKAVENEFPIPPCIGRKDYVIGAGLIVIIYLHKYWKIWGSGYPDGQVHNVQPVTHSGEIGVSMRYSTPFEA